MIKRAYKLSRIINQKSATQTTICREFHSLQEQFDWENLCPQVKVPKSALI